MNVLVVLLLCFHQYIPLEGLQLAPYQPSLAPSSERAKFLQAAAAQGDAALIGFIHKSDPLAWDGDAWRRVHGTTALHAAAESGNALAVRALIVLGANVSAVDDQHRTPLHITARADGALGATSELLAAGAEVDAATLSGVTPLMEAVLHGAPNTVAVLLYAGADRGKAPDGGLSVAVQALQKRHPQISTWILGAHPVPAPDYYSYPCRQDDPNDPNFQSVYLGSTNRNSTDSLFRTSLHQSCNLLTSSPTVNARDIFQRTPLHTAVLRDDYGCVQKLLKSGADPKAVDWLKRTPLQLAKVCHRGNSEYYLKSQVITQNHAKQLI